MKNYLLIITLLLTFGLNAQSPKEIINSMRRQLDSLESSLDIEPEKTLTDSPLMIGYNQDAKIDHIFAKGETVPPIIRIFDLQEKHSKDKQNPRDNIYPKETNESTCFHSEVDWNGTLCDVWNRTRNIRNKIPDAFIVYAWETIYPRDSRKDFPGKHYNFYDFAYVDGSNGWDDIEKQKVYNKAYELYYAWFSAVGDMVDAVSFNEWWSLSKEELEVLEEALFNARRDWNHNQGRFSNYIPMLGTNTLPIGQGTRYRLSVDDIATFRILEYDFIDVHTYMIDRHGKWQDDFSIAEEQLNIALDFQKKYAPNTPIWITETGAPEYTIPNQFNQKTKLSYGKKFYQNLVKYTQNNPQFQAIFGYAYQADPSDLFGQLYMIDENGNETDSFKYLKSISDE